MRYRWQTFGGALAIGSAVVSTAAVTVAGQAVTPAGKITAVTKNWTAPRTPDGQPDLQGVWANNNVTPLERPKQWAGKQFLTEQERAELKQFASGVIEGGNDAIFGDNLVLLALERQKNATSRDGCAGRAVTEKCVTPGNYNAFWLVDRDFDNPRTSLVIDPPDGRIPALTPEAQKREAAAAEYGRLHDTDGPESRNLGERCLYFGLPKIGAGYMNYYQIFQSRDYVAIVSELAHDTRIIPLDGRPHVNLNIRQWYGDARGRWQGDTLVVDTTNFSPKSGFRGSRENFHLVERFTRVGPNTLQYEATVDDPTTWTKPWTVSVPMKHTDDAIFEYACHEGNHGLAGILAGARAAEKATQAAAKSGSR